MFRRLRGFAIPVVLLGLCAPAGAAGAGGADAGTLLAKHRAFVGWQLGDGTFTTLRLTRRKGAGESVTERTTELRIGLIYHNTSIYPKRGDTVEEDGFTGRIFWSSNINGFTTPIYGDSAKFRLSYALLMNEGTTTLQGVDRGPATIDGKQVETVRLDVPNADPIEVAIDPQSGAFRTRYAGATLTGAFRERYGSTGLVIPADHRTHHLVRLVSARNLRVLDLRTEKNLDVLGVDDQISTGQHPDVWATCHRLVDAARRWWTDIDAIVYRPRTTPESSLNYAFFGDDGFDVESWPLGERVDVLAALVLHEGFTVNWDFDIE